MNKTNWKDHINTSLLGIVCYLLVDIHSSFKQVVKDVETLKEQVLLHEYRLNENDDKKPNKKHNGGFSEAILPNDNRFKKQDSKSKYSNS